MVSKYDLMVKMPLKALYKSVLEDSARSQCPEGQRVEKGYDRSKARKYEVQYQIQLSLPVPRLYDKDEASSYMLRGGNKI